MQSAKIQILRKSASGESSEAFESDRTALHDALLREIAKDARQEPERYLRDSIVPEGGE